MKIYLARHGQDEDNKAGILNGHRDTPLTELGRQQAEKAAQEITDHKLVFDMMYTSPLQRAHQTACIISEKANQPEPITLPDLIERDFGGMTGELVADIETLCAPHILKANLVTYFLKPENGETFPNTLARVSTLLAFLSKNHDQQSVLLVTHGDIGKMIYAAFYDLPWQSVLKDFHFGNSEVLLLSEDSDPEDTHIFSIEQYNH